jgi:MFS-type transporter involved in bile tolerance (Atg22 family)
MSDVIRGKKRFLGFFVSVGSIATGLMVLIDRGDWLLASLLFIVGRIGFAASNVFYDSLLPHVARPEDQDSVSSRGYAFGYLGGGLLLTINVVMVFTFPGNWGARFSFLSVGLWWALFSIPIFLLVPEPPAAKQETTNPLHIIRVSFSRLWHTFQDLRRYRELLKFLFAFLIYNDGIGTIIGMAAIYGAELGFDAEQLVLAILLVQFVGIPFSLAFGRMPNPRSKGRAFLVAFISLSIISIPVLGVLGAKLLPNHWIGGKPSVESPSTDQASSGFHPITSALVRPAGKWELVSLKQADLQRQGIEGFVQRNFGAELEQDEYVLSRQARDSVSIPVHGQNFQITYATGPDLGSWTLLVDQEQFLNRDGKPWVVSAWSDQPRFGLHQKIHLPEPGPHTLTIVSQAGDEGGIGCSIGGLEVLPNSRQSSIGVVVAGVCLVQVLCLIGALLLKKPINAWLGPKLTSKGCILMALTAYGLIAIWGFFLNSVFEFWLLAWMVAVVQGGSQALSRSLYATLSPPSKSGEFFGLFSVMAKFSSFSGPLVFAAAAATFGSSRPAILSILVFFVVGGWLLSRVNVRPPGEEPLSELAS